MTDRQTDICDCRVTFATEKVSKITNDSSSHPSVSLVNQMILEVAVNLRGQLLLRHVEPVPGGEEGDLGSVLVEHHRVEVPTLVVLDQKIFTILYKNICHHTWIRSSVV